MGAALDHDLSGVKVHTDAKADTLSRDLNAEAFTTGQDIFFRQGAYEPGSDSGRELIAHELTHVVQQGAGEVSSGQGMTVNPPDDVYEQEADAVAQQVVHAGGEATTAGAAGGMAQRQDIPEEEMQAKAAQRQMPEEEEAAQMKQVQRQEEEEEMAQMKQVQRQEEEEEMAQMKQVQRQEEEEEMVQPKQVQR
jgi:hypothetical protein